MHTPPPLKIGLTFVSEQERAKNDLLSKSQAQFFLLGNEMPGHKIQYGIEGDTQFYWDSK